MNRFVIFLFFSLLLFSCGEQESIDPAFQSSSFKKTLEKEEKSEGLLISYEFGSFEVDRVGQNIGEVPLIGGLLQRMTESLADIVIEEGRVHEIPPTVFSLPELENIDFSLIDSLKIDKVTITASKPKKKSRLNLSFIKEVRVKLISSIPQKVVKGQKSSSKESMEILSFQRNKRDALTSERQIQLKPTTKNLKKIVKTYRQFRVETKVIVDSVPKAEMALAGEIHFRLQVDPGF